MDATELIEIFSCIINRYPFRLSPEEIVDSYLKCSFFKFAVRYQESLFKWFFAMIFKRKRNISMIVFSDDLRIPYIKDSLAS